VDDLEGRLLRVGLDQVGDSIAAGATTSTRAAGFPDLFHGGGAGGNASTNPLVTDAFAQTHNHFSSALLEIENDFQLQD
jgi:hypothetical protein